MELVTLELKSPVALYNEEPDKFISIAGTPKSALN
jgi:hypothetical protein